MSPEQDEQGQPLHEFNFTGSIAADARHLALWATPWQWTPGVGFENLGSLSTVHVFLAGDPSDELHLEQNDNGTVFVRASDLFAVNEYCELFIDGEPVTFPPFPETAELPEDATYICQSLFSSVPQLHADDSVDLTWGYCIATQGEFDECDYGPAHWSPAAGWTLGPKQPLPPL